MGWIFEDEENEEKREEDESNVEAEYAKKLYERNM